MDDHPHRVRRGVALILPVAPKVSAALTSPEPIGGPSPRRCAGVRRTVGWSVPLMSSTTALIDVVPESTPVKRAILGRRGRTLHLPEWLSAGHQGLMCRHHRPRSSGLSTGTPAAPRRPANRPSPRPSRLPGRMVPAINLLSGGLPRRIVQ